MSKKLDAITSRSEDFAQWYTDVCKKSELVDYSSVRGCMIFRPYGYAIWELIQKQLDQRFKATGHENVYMPMFIPESLLQKEADHVEGFAPEVAWVTHGGHEKLEERLLVRPTSEVLFCEHYSNIIQSHRDLPKLYNQWCSVVRWEKTTRPFLRSMEFLWQEGHTAHATAEEAQEETLRMLDTYVEFCKNVLAIPMVFGQKTEKEKFAGAKATYTIESLMPDGKALQSGTTHNFGDGFAKAFDIQYTDKENKLQYVHQTSWGVTTRLIGAVIMVHSDDNGLVVPPRIAPNQVVIIPVAQHKEGVLDKANELLEKLSKNIRVKLDQSDKSPGWKFSEHEMKGVPIRLEIGPKDIENNQCVLARRDTGEKIIVSLDNVESEIERLLDEIHHNLYEKADKYLGEKTYIATTMEEFSKILEETPGFIKAMWCEDEKCELEIKEKTGATSRCMPFAQEKIADKCIVCGKDATKMVYWGKAY
ncbi:MAG: proline--tRNA ligase [Defluviitaleaceae bacterium]|nr:proline--tRNA ligase [Defluviitaleaceae bacterium]